MSWKWLIDTRGGRRKVDHPRLFIVAGAAAVVIAASRLLEPAIAIPLLFVGGFIGVALDIKARREPPS